MDTSAIVDFIIRNQQYAFASLGLIIGLLISSIYLLRRTVPEVRQMLPSIAAERSVQFLDRKDERYQFAEVENPRSESVPIIVRTKNDGSERDSVETLGLTALPSNKNILSGVINVAQIPIVASLVKELLIPAEVQGLVKEYFQDLRKNLFRRVGTVAIFVIGFLTIAASGGFAIGERNPISKTAGLDDKQLTLDLTKNDLILFVQGWRGDAEGTWLKFPDLVRHDPRFSDTHVAVANYPTFMTRRSLTIGETASWIAEKLERNGVDHYSKVAIISHSIGGLVLRKLILQRRSMFHGVGILIEVGTPHTGTERYAQLLDDLGIRIPQNDLVLEVKAGSDFLRQLSNDWNALDRRTPTLCFASPNDEVVPQDSALFQCDKLHYLPGFDHTAMVQPNDAQDDRYRVPMHEVDAFFHSGEPVITRRETTTPKNPVGVPTRHAVSR